jgi:hypothetical protein
MVDVEGTMKTGTDRNPLKYGSKIPRFLLDFPLDQSSTEFCDPQTPIPEATYIAPHRVTTTQALFGRARG